MSATVPPKLVFDPSPKMSGDLDANHKNAINFAQIGAKQFLDDSLVGWWPFVGSAVDMSQFGNDGTLTGGANVAKGVLDLDGTGDWVDVGSDDSLNLTNTVLFERESQSADTSSHQGVADDGVNLFTFGTLGLYKRNRTSPYAATVTMLLSTIQTAAGGDLDDCDHLGDGVAYGDYLYVPCEYYLDNAHFGHQHILRLNKSDLTYSAHWDISAQNHEISGVACDGTYLYATSFVDGTKIWKYSMTGSYVGSITLSPALGANQGITYSRAKNSFYISGTAPGTSRVGIHQVAMGGAVGDLVYHSITTYHEGLDFTQSQMLFLEDEVGGDARINFLRERAALTGYTISAWIRPGSDITTEQAVVTRYNYTNAIRQYYLTVFNGCIYFLLVKLDQSYANPHKAITASVWQHVVGVADFANSVALVYVNAGTPASVAYTDKNIGFTQSVGIGAILGAAAANAFTGQIADVRIYNRPFAAAEIQALYAQEKGRFDNDVMWQDFGSNTAMARKPWWGRMAWAGAGTPSNAIDGDLLLPAG